MNLMDPKTTIAKIILLIPIILCLLSIYGVEKTNGNIIAGFNTMEQKQKDDLIKKGYILKVKKMILIMCIPLIIAFLCSFFISNIQLFNAILIIAWILFGVITVLGIFIVNYLS